MIKKFARREEGQGLVEYALILVLVAIVVIAILLQMGPSIRLVFGRVTAVLQNSGVVTASGYITGVNAKYTAPFLSNPGKVTVTINVSQNTTVTITGDHGVSGGGSCNAPSCQFVFNGTFPADGQVVIQDDSGGQGVTANW
jgi:pilus assembly protein Flp/PilA